MHAPQMEINADALEAAALERQSRVEESESDKRDRKRVGLKVLLEASFARTSNSPLQANRCGGRAARMSEGRKEGSHPFGDEWHRLNARGQQLTGQGYLRRKGRRSRQ